ncbi:MAG TPA: SDR family NAD(P)-dependent oxidoreductase, partial [Ramlibacter sp.]|nr:SDR family NAD(P)-dependent oxidoreductase [Ramlibacter sp.]
MTAEQRHVVVVGAAGGIGRAISMRFAQGGCAVHMLGRNLARLAEAARVTAEATGAAVSPLECDLERPDSLAEAFAALPRIDVLVNAAGNIPRKSLHETRPEDWRGAWSAKVLGAVETSRLASDRMRATGGGVIVNIIGIAGIHLNPRTIMTSTANAALIAFTQAMG